VYIIWLCIEYNHCIFRQNWCTFAALLIFAITVVLVVGLVLHNFKIWPGLTKPFRMMILSLQNWFILLMVAASVIALCAQDVANGFVLLALAIVQKVLFLQDARSSAATATTYERLQMGFDYLREFVSSTFASSTLADRHRIDSNDDPESFMPMLGASDASRRVPQSNVLPDQHLGSRLDDELCWFITTDNWLTCIQSDAKGYRSEKLALTRDLTGTKLRVRKYRNNAFNIIHTHDQVDRFLDCPGGYDQSTPFFNSNYYPRASQRWFFEAVDDHKLIYCYWDGVKLYLCRRMDHHIVVCIANPEMAIRWEITPIDQVKL
jgi:hypothetical protein